jgi:hypothetical protein
MPVRLCKLKLKDYNIRNREIRLFTLDYFESQPRATIAFPHYS